MAKKHKIIVNYDTGDSFGTSPNQECDLVEEWNNLDIAKENLKRIDEHNKAYCKINGWSNYGKSSWKDYRNERWYCKDYPEFTIRLLKDDGQEYNEHCTWCGYFESMNYAEIVSIESDTKVYGGKLI